jgi:hypothetical protein
VGEKIDSVTLEGFFSCIEAYEWLAGLFSLQEEAPEDTFILRWLLQKD